MKTYPVLKPVHHDGVLYDAPDTLVLEDGAAAALQAVGAVGGALEEADVFDDLGDLGDDTGDDTTPAPATKGRHKK